jgi:nitrogen regulatory protein P-II 2
MKMIVAVIKPSRLDAVLDAVTEAGASGLTVTEVRGYGRQRGKTEVYRGAEYEVKLLPKVKLEIAVPDDVADAIVEALASSANTGKIGDGKVFVMDLEQALRIRTGDVVNAVTHMRGVFGGIRRLQSSAGFTRWERDHASQEFVLAYVHIVQYERRLRPRPTGFSLAGYPAIQRWLARVAALPRHIAMPPST